MALFPIKTHVIPCADLARGWVMAMGRLRHVSFEYDKQLGCKGAAFRAASFRTYCSESGFDGIVVWPSLDGAYLEGGDLSVLTHYQEMLDRMDMYDAGREALELVIFGESEKLGFDSTGRISLPAKFRDHAALSGKATFVGRGRKFEIWDEAAHEARRSELREKALANRHRMKPI